MHAACTLACHLYEEKGIQALAELDGMFAGVLYDEKAEVVFLFRDPLGEKPLFIYKDTTTSGLVFSSQVRSFSTLPHIHLSLNRQAIWDIPTFLWVPEPDSIWNEVGVLPPGGVISVNRDGQYRTFELDVLCNLNSDPLTDDVAIDHLRSTLRDSIHKRLLSDMPVGCFLSGGLDSSIVAAMMREKIEYLDKFRFVRSPI